MKKALTILSAATALLMAGCSSFLDVETLGKSTIDGFFSDVDGLKAAGVGLHRCILEFYDDEYMRMGDLGGDLANLNKVNSDYNENQIFDFASIPGDNSGFPRLIWREAYAIATNANNILHYGARLLEEFPEDEDVINKNFAYAHFARALAIFDLCNCYAQPYCFTPDASHPGVVPIDYVPGFDDVIQRKSVKDCYDLILSDLNTALELFGNDDVADVHYISGLACEALLARVYLYMKDYTNAALYAEMVMDKVPLSPASEYVDMFRKAQAVPGAEAILRLNSYDTGTGMKSLCSPIGGQEMTVADETIAMFADNDVRKQLFTYVGESEDGEAYVGKVYTAACKYLAYKDCEQKEENRRWDPMILRCSEMYLIHAEAMCLGPQADLAAAAEDIRALRARALDVDKSAVTVSYSNAADLDRIIEQERMKELCFEGHRFFDLKRRGQDIVRTASSTSTCKKISYPDYRFCLPICQAEMEANPHMVQNEGY